MLTEEEKDKLRKSVHDSIWRELAQWAILAVVRKSKLPREEWGAEWQRLVEGDARNKIENSGLAPFNEMMGETYKARKRATWREDQQKRRDKTVEFHDETTGRCDILPDVDIPVGLSDRERQVALMLLEGYTQKEIASALGVSPPYVNRIVKSLRVKLSETK